MEKIRFGRRAATFVAAASVFTLAACTTTPPNRATPSPQAAAALEAQVDASLARLYTVAPEARELVARSAGVLVFPQVVSASAVVGAEHGRGALMVGGKIVEHYGLTGASVGWQAGAQSRAMIYVFNTTDALNKFRESRGWSAGVDATVAVATIGANSRIDTTTMRQPVVAFAITNAGLEAGVALQGTRIAPITL